MLRFTELETGIRDLEIEDRFSEKLEEYFSKLLDVNKQLNELREEIKKDKLAQFTDEEKDDFRKRLKVVYKEQDNLIEHTEEASLSLEEKEKFYQNEKYIKILSVKLDNQILIGRMINKVQREEATRIAKKNEELKRESENLKLQTEVFNQEIEKTSRAIKEENASMKESILTVTSLVFTAFSFIQINFVAFQNSKDYLVLDRIILFSGINVFLIVGVYSILSMIKSFFRIEVEEGKEKHLFKKIILVFIFFMIIFGGTLCLKGKTEKYEKKNNIIVKKLEKENKELKEKIESYEKEMDNKLNNLELQIINYKKEQSLLENDFLEYKENMNKKK
ncbi:hypothetical protein [Fusobacterium perfoetens]|uniref:hypothetical protein n=1 Tax=Fusobacterium perfoetens TaxID=852 RepID=UPI001F20D101|nr:hypothetical protein [Fusobacterium perfoetens]MCF2612864.1 hypothetical protein [Fusobacterium perfoetens]